MGCSAPGGLELELDASADPTADAITVYIGGGKGVGASIATRGTLPASTNLGTFFPDAHGNVEVLDLTSSRRTATLSLVPGAGAGVLTIVAVGMTGDVPTSVATQILVPINSEDIFVWKLALEPLQSVDSTSKRSVVLWGEKPDDHDCVQASDRSTDKPMFANVFVGSDGDKDCDGYPELVSGRKNPKECDDEWHGAKSTPSISTLSCMEDQTVTSGPGATNICLFGAPSCVDGVGGDACNHTKPFCAPVGLCGACQMPDPATRFACALDLDPVSTMSFPYVACSIEVDSSGKVCPMPTRAQPPSGWYGGNPAACTGPPMFHPQARSAPWGSTATVGGINLAFASSALGSCGFQLTAALSSPNQIEASAFPAHGLIALELTGGRGVIAPIEFELDFVSECSMMARACVLSGQLVDPSIQNCLMLAPTSP